MCGNRADGRERLPADGALACQRPDPPACVGDGTAEGGGQPVIPDPRIVPGRSVTHANIRSVTVTVCS